MHRKYIALYDTNSPNNLLDTNVLVASNVSAYSQLIK